jgi:hypothetical protein
MKTRPLGFLELERSISDTERAEAHMYRYDDVVSDETKIVHDAPVWLRLPRIRNVNGCETWIID